MADERPLNLVQFVVGYFDIGTLSEISECLLRFAKTFSCYYGDSK
ncbi:hypothetical protein [Lactiplantibacillus argentoratensis]|nr:hypothetical protein [Lactiplantibacillus argentoratensis]